MHSPRPQVVVVGAGFGGLRAARDLARAPVDVVVVDRTNHHLFQPLLYQVATAALNPSDIAVPIRRILRGQHNATVLLADAVAIDPVARTLALDTGSLRYDYLVLATGATHSYFGRDDWAVHAPGLKTLEDALDIRVRVLSAYEAAEREDDPAKRDAWLSFAVVGGGPTGVELAGALAEIARHALAKDFRRIDPGRARVLLVEAADRILGSFTPDLADSGAKALARLGVEVRTGARVTSIDGLGLTVGDERIPCRTVLWAAGVQASPLARSLGAPLDRAGRVIVGPDLAVPHCPGAFAIGDVAAFEQDGRTIPGVAPAAIQQGRHVAANIIRLMGGREAKPFRYRDKGALATIGRAAGLADLGRIKLTGFLGWAAWLFVHVLFLIGFRSRLAVMISWAWAYATYDRGARLITARPRGRNPLPETPPDPPNATPDSGPPMARGDST